MREIALHLLDIAENSVRAQAKNITIDVCEDLVSDLLEAAVHDDGCGMDAATVTRVIDPFVTSRTTRKVGLGIPLLKAAAEMCGGSLKIESTLGVGTHLEVSFRRSHIDRMPLGDLASTVLTLVVAYPEIHWVFNYRGIFPPPEQPGHFYFDDEPIKDTLGDVPLCEPEVLAYLKDLLGEGVGQIQKMTEPYDWALLG
jgi:hypothetical protein